MHATEVHVTVMTLVIGLAQEVPFMDMFLEAGGQQHRQQQLWMLHLLSVSLRNPADATTFR